MIQDYDQADRAERLSALGDRASAASNRARAEGSGVADRHHGDRARELNRQACRAARVATGEASSWGAWRALESARKSDAYGEHCAALQADRRDRADQSRPEPTRAERLRAEAVARAERHGQANPARKARQVALFAPRFADDAPKDTHGPVEGDLFGGAFGKMFEHPEPDPARHTLGIVGCSRTKLDQAAPARELYARSSYFRLCFEAAAVECDSVMILSALHGLVEPDTVLSPYNVTFGDPQAIGAETIAHQLADAGMIGADLMVFAGRRYWQAIYEAGLYFPDDQADDAGELFHVFDGCQGIGDQRHVARSLIDQAASKVQPSLF